MAKSETKSKKPTGLSIERSGSSFTFKWKIGDKDYDGGQKLRYRIRTGANWGAWTTLTKSTSPRITANQTSFTRSFTLSTLKAVEFQVCGNRAKYKKKASDTSYVNPGWSDWASKTWTATVPSVTSLTYTNNAVNAGTFTWAAPNDKTGTKVFTRIEAQTCYIRSSGNPSSSNWGAVMTKGASGSQAITENTETIAAGNIVRWYRVRAVGPAGASGWKTSYHAYGLPIIASLESATATRIATVTRIKAKWKDAYNRLRPIDKITLQYVIAVPDGGLENPPSSGWQDAIEVKPNGNSDTIIVNVDDRVEADQVMWVRVASDHDGNVAYSGAKRAQTGKLTAPTINATPDTTTGQVAITITEETPCVIAKTAIIYRAANKPSNDRIIAILPRGTTTTTVTVPDIVGKSTTCFGAFAFIGASSGLKISSKQMVSDTAIDSDISPVAPASVTVMEGSREGTVRIAWDWSWADATQAELSWSEYEDAWESTEKPATFTVEDRFATSWLITGLDVGKRWFFRVRLSNEDEDTVTFGPYSAVVSYDLSVIPDRPALSLSKSVINEGENVTARWAFSSADGVVQDYAEIALATVSGETVTIGDVIAHVDTGQSVEISREWVTGQTYYMCVRTTATSGIQSAWSEPASLYVAEPVTIEISHTSLVSGTVEDETVYTLTQMPLTVTVLGAGASGTTTVSIIRDSDYHLYRPDEKDYDGYAGETIATYAQTGEAQITFTVADLVGSLDDVARYRIIATVEDTYGQTATAERVFSVDWTHKAGVPSVTVVTDTEARISKITPIAPENYADGDVCDIYRLTIDKPELIYMGATFGETYVDPFPAFGDAAGHRLVTRTANGDYTTAEGVGWYDSGEDDGDLLESLLMVVDIDGAQIELPYNLVLNNKWNKDFKRTVYLGGSVQGDWNPGVTRDLTADTVIVRGDELDKQIDMRNLAGYAGVAQIRTPDGSSFAANIQISESQSHDTKKISYSLSIQTIDPQEPEGMTLAEWEAMQSEEEEPEVVEG